MIIIELVEGEETLDDIERISEDFCEHEDIGDLIPEEQLEIIEAILKPTLAEDGNESEKRKLWRRLLTELVITTDDGKKLQFFRDKKHNRLYFGDKVGFETITELSENEASITESKRRF